MPSEPLDWRRSIAVKIRCISHIANAPASNAITSDTVVPIPAWWYSVYPTSPNSVKNAEMPWMLRTLNPESEPVW